MKRKKKMQFFMEGFIQSFVLVMLLLITAFISYKATILYARTNQTEDSPENKKSDVIIEASVDEIAVNLVYGVEEETGVIKQLLLEVFNSETKNTDFITIPMNTRFAVSQTLSERLYKVNENIPQIITFADLHKYFDESSIYEYGVLLIQDLLDIKVSFYTAVEQKQFDEMFQKESMDGVEKIKFTDSFQEKFLNMQSTNEMELFLSDYYEMVKTNLTVEKRKTYIAAYNEIKPIQIYYYVLPGTVIGESYEPDVTVCREQLQTLFRQDSYQIAQSEGQQLESEDDIKGISSVGKSIQLLNGSRINGLGAHYKEVLSQKGFTISSLDNYTEEVLSETMIYVTDEGMGQDLADCFQGAVIEVRESNDPFDIVIILGTKDNVNN